VIDRTGSSRQIGRERRRTKQKLKFTRLGGDLGARDWQDLAAEHDRLNPTMLVVCVRYRRSAAGIDDRGGRVIDLADDVRHLT